MNKQEILQGKGKLYICVRFDLKTLVILSFVFLRECFAKFEDH